MDGEGMQVLGEGGDAANLEAKAGTAGAATPLSHEEVRQVVDDALKSYGVATSEDVAGVADSAASAAAGKVAGSDGTTQVVKLEEQQLKAYTARTGYMLGMVLVLVVMVAFIAGETLAESLVDGWR